MCSGLGGGREIFFLGRGQHLLAKIRKPRLPRSHEILMFVCLQKDAKLKLSCNANLPQAAPDFRIGWGQWRRAQKIWSKLAN